MATTNLTPERLRQVLHYNPLTGIFTWLVNPSKRYKAGMVAGTCSNGYIAISVDKRLYYAHRLAWLYVYGEWPEFEIDHEDRVKSNNRFENLRDATRKINSQNIAIANSNNTGTGMRGVFWVKAESKYRAHLMVDGRTVFQRSFKSLEQARSARLAAVKFHHPGFKD